MESIDHLLQSHLHQRQAVTSLCQKLQGIIDRETCIVECIDGQSLGAITSDEATIVLSRCREERERECVGLLSSIVACRDTFAKLKQRGQSIEEATAQLSWDTATASTTTQPSSVDDVAYTQGVLRLCQVDLNQLDQLVHCKNQDQRATLYQSAIDSHQHLIDVLDEL
eukprot:TRINITY_DN8568_c0_g1_i1.p1 TRINITY_DN8568_c0_g1~~TRINITY_DN8568_c0_g1_i1.p1  ORF type:complete len:168 (+),score=23.17 TRINITY_DN8568_c0_g1_i1:41-544(+)